MRHVKIFNKVNYGNMNLADCSLVKITEGTRTSVCLHSSVPVSNIYSLKHYLLKKNWCFENAQRLKITRDKMVSRPGLRHKRLSLQY